MAFDIDGALKAGYSKPEIADYLAQGTGFNIAGAREVGYTDDEIIGHLNPKTSMMDRVKETAGSIGQGMVDLMPSRAKPNQADYERANKSTQQSIEAQTDQPQTYVRPENAPTQTASDQLKSWTVDPVAGFAKGAGTLGRAAGWLAGSETLEQWGKDAEAFWASKQTDQMKQSIAEVERAQGFGETLRALGRNPDALVDMIAQSVPMMAPGMGTGAVGARIAGSLGFRWATAAGMSEQVAAQVAEKAAMRVAIGANIAGEGVVSGGATGSIVEEVAKAHGATDRAASSAANESAMKAGLWTAAGAALGAGMETRAMLGKLKETGFAGAAKNIGKEMAEEAVQNPGEEYFQYQGVSKFDPDAEFDLGKSVATGLAAGGAMGAGFHAAGRMSRKEPTMAEQRDAVLGAESIDEAIMTAAEAVDTPTSQQNPQQNPQRFEPAESPVMADLQTEPRNEPRNDVVPTAINDRAQAAQVQTELAAMAPQGEPYGQELGAADAEVDTQSLESPGVQLRGSEDPAQPEPTGDVRATAGSSGFTGTGNDAPVPVEPAQPSPPAVKEPAALNRASAERLAKQYGDSAVVPHPSKPGMFTVVPADLAVKQDIRVPMSKRQQASDLVQTLTTTQEPVKETPKVQQIAGRDIDGDWTEFAKESGTLSVPRAEMPQIKAEHRGAMVNFLNARGIEHQEEVVPATSLKPTQAEFSRQKVQKAKEFEGGDRAILVSADGHVLDGHHQWMAKRDAGEDVRVIRLKAPIRDLLKVVPEFPSATVSEGALDTNKENEDARQSDVSKPAAAEQRTDGQPAVEGAAQESKIVEPASQTDIDDIVEVKDKYGRTIRVRQSDLDGTAERIPTFRANGKAVVGEEIPRSILAEAAPQPESGKKTASRKPVIPATAIEDFGEKIGGARKDVWSTFKDSLERVGDADIAEQPLSKIWPAPDYQSLIDSGMAADKVAFVRAVRDEIPAKPRKGYKVKRWADQVKTLRQMAIDVMDDTTSIQGVRAKMADLRDLAGLLGRMDLYEAVGHSKSLEGITLKFHHYTLYKGRENVSLWAVERDAAATAFSNWPQEISTGDTKEEAIAAFKSKYPTIDSEKAVRKASFDLYTQTGVTGILIGKKVGRNLIQLAGPFESVKEAREYRESNLDELNARLERNKEIPRERRDSNDPRVGEDMRNGQDVTPEMFGQAFGFKGVEFGNWVEQSKRQKNLNDAYDALMDMAAILEIPPKAISLNGQLGLAFGARGSGGIGAAAAHYERDFVVINLTKKEGAGSLGHEWWHALDNYFSRSRGKSADMMTEALDVSLAARESQFIANTSVRKEMIEAFGAVVRAIKKTAIKARSAKLDSKRAKEYWTTGPEMSARAFESYLISKLQDQNASNDYLANIVDEDTWKAAASMGFELDDSYPYPTAGEMPEIRAGFDKFFQTVESKETEAGTALFSRAANAEDFAAQAAIELAADDELFRHPHSERHTLEGVFADVVPDAVYKGEDTRPEDTDHGADVRYLFELDRRGEKRNLYVFVDRDKKRVWLDVSRSAPGAGGNAVYMALANWAHNTGYTFVADPLGLTREAKIARAKAMLSSALRYGTTRHFQPGENVEWGDPDSGIEPLEWGDDDLENMKSLIHTVTETVFNHIPRLRNARYDFRTQQFRDSHGRTLDRSAFDLRRDPRVSNSAKRALEEAGAGEGTLRRVVLFNSLLEAESGAQPGILEGALSGVHRRLGNLQGVFSRQEQEAPGGSTVEQVSDWLAEPLAKLKNIPPVRIVADQFEIPEVERRLNSARERALDLDPEAAREIDSFFKNPVEGAYVDGEIWLVAGSLRNRERALAVLAHEAVGHLAVEQMLDASDPNLMPKLVKQVQTLDKAGNPYIRGLSATVDRRQPDLSAEQHAKEIIALIAERGDENMGAVRPVYQRIIDGIRAFFKLVFDQNLSDQDVRDIVASARRWAEGEHVTLRDGQKLESYSLSRGGAQTDTEAFKRWFGDSKVVDADGKPLVVYHGTDADFSEFSIDRFGRTDGGWAGKGFYFTTRANEAAWYAHAPGGGATGGNIMPVYLRAENPLYWVLGTEEGKRINAEKRARGAEGFAEWVKSQGYDSIRMTSEGVSITEDQWIVFQPEQIKSAVGNRGTFDPKNPDILFSRTPAWEIEDPTDTTFTKSLGMLDTDKDSLIYSLQDKHIDTKRAVQAIRKTSGEIADKWNPYLQEELYHGRAAKRVKDFLDKELRPLLQEMQMRGAEMSDFEEYLWNRHAEERNKQIEKINPDMPDQGSGLKTAEARKYLAELPESKRKAYEALAKRVDEMTANTRKGLVDSGLETQDTIDTWDKTYSHYVPLQREDVETAGTGTGKGYSIRGSSSKRAMGSRKKVADIIANIAQQRERAIVRAEKNRVSNALMGLALTNPNPEFWTVDQAPRERVVEGDQINDRVVPGFIGQDNVVSTRVNGQDHYIVFNESDPRAVRMAKALKNLDADQLGRLLSVSGKVTRYFASINTQYNPIFGVINLTRDVQGSLLNLTTTPIAGKKKRVLGYTVMALRGIYSEVRAQRKGTETDSTWAQLWEEFQREGGQTGYRDQFADAKERARAIEKEIKAFGQGNVKAVGRAIFSWLSDYNETMENAVRLACYRVGLEEGMTKQQAASLAKNISVNFNRKGQVATQVGALYAFFNASVQGTARIVETLKGPAGKKVIAGGILLGAMQTFLLAIAGMDDDQPPEFIKERALILPIGNGKYLRLPMPLGFHVLVNLGRIPTEFVLSGFRDPGRRVLDLVGVLADGFNPIGNAGVSLQTIAPTGIDPLAALAENRDWTGKPIYKENMRALAPEPGHARAKDTASEISKTVSYWLNIASGGTKYKPGLISPTPDQLDYLIDQVTGGVGREYLKAEQTAASAITGEELPLHKIPLVGRFIGDTKGQSAESGKFYESIKRLNEHEAEIKGLRKEGRGREIEGYYREYPEARLVQAANGVEREISRLRSSKRDALEKGQTERVKVLERMISERMRRFNERLKRVSEQQAA